MTRGALLAVFLLAWLVATGWLMATGDVFSIVLTLGLAVLGYILFEIMIGPREETLGRMKIEHGDGTMPTYRSFRGRAGDSNFSEAELGEWKITRTGGFKPVDPEQFQSRVSAWGFSTHQHFMHFAMEVGLDVLLSVSADTEEFDIFVDSVPQGTIRVRERFVKMRIDET